MDFSKKKVVGMRGISATKSVAIAAMLLAGAAHASADDNTSIKGIEDLTGKTIAEVRTAAQENPSSINYNVTDPSKVFFLYNVGTGKFLNFGGEWGTHIYMRDYGMMLMPIKWKTNDADNAINFAQNIAGAQTTGNYLSYKQTPQDANTGVFIDKNTIAAWYFETESSDAKNGYKVYYRKSSEELFYLYAIDTEETSANNAEAVLKSNIPTGASDVWRIYSLEQINELQKQNTDDMSSMIDYTYQLTNASFARGYSLSQWKTDDWKTATDGKWRFGLENLNTTLTGYPTYSVTANSSYTFGNTTYSISESTTTAGELADTKYLEDLGKYFCADVKNIHGRIYQDIQVTNSGTFVIEVKGYSNTNKAHLFASIVSGSGDNTTESEKRSTTLSQISEMSSSDQEALHTSEKNMDYAGSNFYSNRKYINSVMVRVPETVNGSAVSSSNPVTVRFGIEVGSSDDTDTPTDEWTVFDDFRFLFAAKSVDTHLVLDEDRTSLDYLTTTSNVYRNNILHLKKTFTKDVWNSFILPVSLTREQLRTAFGANVRLAKLEQLTSNEIRFKSVDLSNIKDSETALEANTPYIIVPTKGQLREKTTTSSLNPIKYSDENPVYCAKLTSTGSGSETTTISAGISENHYEIPNVTLPCTSDGTGYTNDWSSMDTNTWTLKSAANGTDSSNGSSISAHATYARTFASQATQDATTYVWNISGASDKSTIISGRDNLSKSYFLDNGSMYYTSSKARGLRGFNCWFKENATQSSTEGAKTMLLSLDGVTLDETTTGISQIFGGDEDAVKQYANGIYSINGQKVADSASQLQQLPAGVYIVNGKKYVVNK